MFKNVKKGSLNIFEVLTIEIQTMSCLRYIIITLELSIVSNRCRFICLKVSNMQTLVGMLECALFFIFNENQLPQKVAHVQTFN